MSVCLRNGLLLNDICFGRFEVVASTDFKSKLAKLDNSSLGQSDSHRHALAVKHQFSSATYHFNSPLTYRNRKTFGM